MKSNQQTVTYKLQLTQVSGVICGKVPLIFCLNTGSEQIWQWKSGLVLRLGKKDSNGDPFLRVHNPFYAISSG